MSEIKVPQGRSEAKVLEVDWNSLEDSLKYKTDIEALNPAPQILPNERF